MKTNRYRLLIITLLFCLVLSGCDSLPFGGDETIQASGVVEIIEVIISPEIGGRIAQVWVDEGDPVAVGAPGGGSFTHSRCSFAGPLRPST